MTVSLPAAEAVHEAVIPLPLEPIWFGVITMVVLLALLGLLWSFRNTLALDPHQYHHDDLRTDDHLRTDDGRAGQDHR